MICMRETRFLLIKSLVLWLNLLTVSHCFSAAPLLNCMWVTCFFMQISFKDSCRKSVARRCVAPLAAAAAAAQLRTQRVRWPTTRISPCPCRCVYQLTRHATSCTVCLPVLDLIIKSFPVPRVSVFHSVYF